MTKAERKLLREMLHRLECYYPVMNRYAYGVNPAQADTHNTERAWLLKVGRKLVTKLCRVRKPKVYPNTVAGAEQRYLDRLGNHFV